MVLIFAVFGCSEKSNPVYIEPVKPPIDTIPVVKHSPDSAIVILISHTPYTNAFITYYASTVEEADLHDRIDTLIFVKGTELIIDFKNNLGGRGTMRVLLTVTNDTSIVGCAQ